MLEKIVILDFGGQYNQLIGRRVREAGVYCEILNYAAPVSGWADESLRGIILTGGPNSVYDEGAPRLGREVFELGVPVLGICYGMQLINYALGGTVEHAQVSEYGHAMLHTEDCPMFDGVSRETAVFMNHTDRVDRIPEGFRIDAHTANCPVAAFSCPEKGLYGMQFHPEVRHTAEGVKMLNNFVLDICGCRGDYRASDMIETMLGEIRAQVGDGKVVAGLSGGVDSSVACTLANRALKPGQLTCVFVDHGLLRLREAESVMQTYRDHLGLNVIHIDASGRFLEALKGVTEPERKRKIIGEMFVRVFEEEAKRPAPSSCCRARSTPTASRAAWAAPRRSRATTTSAGCRRNRCSKRRTSSSRCNGCSRMKSGRSAPRSASPSTWSGGSRSRARASACE